MAGWLVSPERLRQDAPRDSTRYRWWVYDENWQHVAWGIEDDEPTALAAARASAVQHDQPPTAGEPRTRRRT